MVNVHNLIYFMLKLLDYSSNSLVDVVLQIDRDRIPESCIDYPMEAENREILFSFLPDYVRDIGPIVGVDRVHDVIIVDSK